MKFLKGTLFGTKTDARCRKGKTMKRWIALLLCMAIVCSAVVFSVLAAVGDAQQTAETQVQQTQALPEENEKRQLAPDAQSAWDYCASFEAKIGYDELKRVADGFFLLDGKLRLSLNGQPVRDKSGKFGGVSYRCAPNGTCTIEGEHTLLHLCDGTLCVLKDGAPWRNRGFFEYQGNCYYGTESGLLLANAERDGMQFDAGGRYTSGNEQIDEAVRQLIADATDDTMTQEEKLRACYDEVRAHVYYQSNNTHVAHGAPAEEWTEDAMLRLLERRRGNCYCYAAQMYYIARQLGYTDVRAVSGRDAPDYYYIDHGWTEITVDGVAYILDPEMERMRRCRQGRLFMVTYDDTPWQYDPCDEENG